MLELFELFELILLFFELVKSLDLLPEFATELFITALPTPSPTALAPATPFACIIAELTAPTFAPAPAALTPTPTPTPTPVPIVLAVLIKTLPELDLDAF